MAGEISTIHPNVYQKLLHRLLMQQWVSAMLARVLHHLDKFVYRLSFGRYTATRLAGLPIIQLTTIGAKTGQSRTMPLVGLFDEDRFILFATNFGQKHNPGWYYNLKAHPECDVALAGSTKKYIAREADGAEYKKYWERGVSFYAGYQKYKERAAPRHIPIMVLEPKE